MTRNKAVPKDSRNSLTCAACLPVIYSILLEGLRSVAIALDVDRFVDSSRKNSRYSWMDIFHQSLLAQVFQPSLFFYVWSLRLLFRAPS